MPRVSVVMPCFNASRYLGRSIESILAQTLADFEFVIVDDGSTDNSPDLIAGYSDPRIRYIRQENRGPSAARNRGIAAARGSFVAPLDADDIALPERLTGQLRMLQADAALSVIASGYLWIDEDDQQIPWDYYSWKAYPELNDIRGWLVDCPLVPSATMFRRDAWEDIGGFGEELRGGEDWNFWMRLVLRGHQMRWHKEVVCLYRHRHDSLSQDARRMSADCTLALRSVIESAEFPASALAVGYQGLALRYLDGAKRLYSKGLLEEGQAALKDAIDTDPSLAEGEPCRVEDELVNATLDPLVELPIQLLRAMLSNLPRNAQTLRAAQTHMEMRTHLELLMRGLGHRDLSAIRRHLLPVLALLPRLLPERRTQRFIKRAILNRLTRLAHSLGLRRRKGN